MTYKDWFIILGIFVAAGFTAYQYYDGVMSSNESKELTEQLLEKAEKLERANDENKELQKQISEKTSNIVESNEKLIDAQSNTLKKIIGEGIITVDFLKKAPNVYEPQFHKKTSDNVYDLNISITNMDEATKFFKQDQSGGFFIDRKFQDNCKLIFTPANFTGSTTAMVLPHELVFKEGYNNFVISMVSRNISIYREFVLNIINGEIIGGAERLFALEGDEYILKSTRVENVIIDEDYWKKHFVPWNTIIKSVQ